VNYKIEAFVHLYHVWGVLGLLTALVYSRPTWRRWREAGGTYLNGPVDTVQLIVHHISLLGRDFLNIGKIAIARFSGVDLLWPQDPKSPWRYPSDQSLFVGIMLGGISRFITAFYWAEINTGWMTEETVWVPAVPIIIAVLADLSHHSTAWPLAHYRVRLLALAAVLWILIGGITGV
jgi:hypothetical protein